MTASREVTQLLIDWSNGDKSALDELFPIVVGELRRRAHHVLRRERNNQTLQTTALIHETYIQLAGYQRPPCREREHFFAIAAQAMRFILVDQARSRVRAKRVGIKVPLELVQANLAQEDQSVGILALDEALEALRAVDPVRVQVAEMKIFAGLGNEEIANALGLSVHQVGRNWKFTRAYLIDQIEGRRRHEL